MDRKICMSYLNLAITLAGKVILGACVLCLSLVSACQNKTPPVEKKEPEMPKAVTLAEHVDNTPSLEPENKKAALVNVELGLGYLRQGQIARAKTKLTHAVKLAPEVAEAHSALAHFLEQVGDNKEAENEHRKAMRIAGNTGAVHNNYGAFLCRLGRYQEADESFQRALSDKTYARTAEVYENAGICAKKAKELASAHHYFKNALKQDPKRTTALLELCELSLQENNLAEAKRLLGQMKLNADPTSRSLWLGMQVAHQLNDQDSVASQALMLKNLFDDSEEYQLYLKSDLSKSL